MPSAVTVVFDADTQRFRASVDAAGQSVSKSADAIAAAKNKILDSFNAQVKAAAETGVSAEKLASIQTKAATQMATVTEQNATKVINSLDRLAARQKAVAAELGTLQVPHVADNDITDKQRASALIRGGGVRAAENFATQFDIFNRISTIAFPILGASTFVAEIVRGVVALKEMYDTAEKIPTVLRDGFDSLNAPIMANVDGLRKSNDELEISIAHLEHKPANTLALALDEARLNADHLAESAEKAAGEVQKLLKENKIGFMQFALTGQVPTGPVSEEVNKRMKELKDLQRTDRDALRSSNDTPVAAQQRQQQISGAEQALGQWAHAARTDMQSFNKDGKVSANINILEGVEDYTDNLQDQRTEQARNVSDQQKQKKLQDDEKTRQLAAEAARKAQEATRKAIEAQRQMWEAQDDQIRTSGGDTAALEATAWQARIDALKKGSAGYTQQLQYAQHELANAQVAAQKQAAEAAKRMSAEAAKRESDQFSLQRDDFLTSGRRTPQQIADLVSIQMLEALPANIKEATARWREAQAAADRYAEEAQKASDRAAEGAAKNKAQVDLAALAIQEQTGQLSHLDATQQAANIHAQEYATTMVALRKALADANAIDPNGPETINAQAAIDKAEAERKVQVMQDAANSAAATWQGALKNANASWVQDSQDTAKQVVAFYRQAIDGLNDNLSDLMTGKKANFGAYFQGLGKTLANDSLQHLEGSVLGSFGIHTGKPDGSKGNPLNVSIVGGMQQSLPGMGKLMFPGMSDGSDDDSDSGSSSGVGSSKASSHPCSVALAPWVAASILARPIWLVRTALSCSALPPAALSSPITNLAEMSLTTQ